VSASEASNVTHRNRNVMWELLALAEQIILVSEGVGN
jgi:hypothetical protein